jgi:ribose 5-phosphate isomerase A
MVHSFNNSQIGHAIENLSTDVIQRFVKENQVIGLGSGSSVAVLVKKFADLSKTKTLKFVVSSLQIKVVAENSGLNVVDESYIPKIDLVFDGADQIDSKFNMIKGGGGALLKEKILITTAKKVIIIAAINKFVGSFNRAVPIEIHQYARITAANILRRDFEAIPKLRISDKGYPLITESGNIIIDTQFRDIDDVQKLELKLKNIPGVLEVGLFTRRADMFYKANEDGSYEIIKPERNL